MSEKGEDSHLSKRMRRDTLIASFRDMLDHENELNKDAERIEKAIELREKEFSRQKAELESELASANEKMEKFMDDTKNDRELLVEAINADLWRNMELEPTLRGKRDGDDDETVMNTKIYFNAPAVCIASFSSGKANAKDVNIGHIWFSPEGKYECPNYRTRTQRSNVMTLYGRWVEKEADPPSFEIYSVSKVRLNPWMPQAAYDVTSHDTTYNLNNKAMVRTVLTDAVIDRIVKCLQTNLAHEQAISEDNVCPEETVVMRAIIAHLRFLQAPVSIKLYKSETEP